MFFKRTNPQPANYENSAKTDILVLNPSSLSISFLSIPMATPPLSFLQQIYPNSKITTMPIPLFARRVKLISARLYHNSVLSSFKTMADIKIAAWLADAELSTEGGTAKMRPVLLPGIGKIEKERRKGDAENESQEIEVWLPDKAVFFRHLGWYRELYVVEGVEDV